MINSITGLLSAKFPQLIYVQCSNGIEWEISVSEHTLQSLPAIENEVKIYTILQHKEDAMKLFGFSSIEERSVFQDLLKVEGVGPKAALKILSSIPYTSLVDILEEGDLSSLEKVPGVGKKTAQKMLLSLKGKLSLNSTDNEGQKVSGKKSIWDDVILGLADMGFDKKRAEMCVEKIASELPKDLTQSQKEEQILRKAIMELS